MSSENNNKVWVAANQNNAADESVLDTSFFVGIEMKRALQTRLQPFLQDRFESETSLKMHISNFLKDRGNLFKFLSQEALYGLIRINFIRELEKKPLFNPNIETDVSPIKIKILILFFDSFLFHLVSRFCIAATFLWYYAK